MPSPLILVVLPSETAASKQLLQPVLAQLWCDAQLDLVLGQQPTVVCCDTYVYDVYVDVYGWSRESPHVPPQVEWLGCCDSGQQTGAVLCELMVQQVMQNLEDQIF